MPGSIGLWRAIVQRTRADLPVETAAFVLLLCATTLLATGVLYSETVAVGGLRRAVLDAAPAARSVVVRTNAAPGAVASTDAVVARELANALGPTRGEVVLVARSPSLAPAGLASDEARTRLTKLASYQGIEGHAAIVSGRWPAAGRRPLEAVLSEGAAGALGLTVGSRVTLVSGIGTRSEVPLEVVGVYRPDRTDPYWLGDPQELDGIVRTDTLTTRGPFVVAGEDLLAGILPGTLELQWRGLPDPDGLRVETIETLGGAISGLDDRLRATGGPLRDVSVTTGLPAILAAVDRAILVSRSTVTLLTIQFAVLAGYAVLLVGGMLVDRRRAEVALLRSRGAGQAQVAGVALGEAVLLAIPAVTLAPFAAVAIVGAMAAVGPLADSGITAEVATTPATIAAAVLAGIGGVLVLTIPSFSIGGPIAGVRATLGRQVGRTLPQRLGLDLVLVVLAIVALWQLSLYGAPITRNARGILGLDPLLVAAPAIGLLAGAVLATRLVPRLAEVGERIARRRRGAVAPLGARQLARRPLRSTRIALLLILAAALGTFAATSAATWTRSQADQAAYRAASDLRVAVPDYPRLETWATGAVVRAIPGVTSASPVIRSSIDVGRTVRDGQLLGIDAGATAGLVAYPPGDPGRDLPALLAGLAAGRPTSGAVTIEGEPARFAVTLDSDVQAAPGSVGPDGSPVDLAVPGIEVSVVVRDGDGHLHRLAAEPAPLVGAGQRIEIPLTATTDRTAPHPVFPLSLVSVEVDVAPPLNVPVVGTVSVRGVAASPSATGDEWRPTGWDPGAAGWDWFRTDQAGTRSYRAPAGAPGRLEFGTGADTDAGPVFGTPEVPGVTFRSIASPPGDGVVGVIASDRYLEGTGARVGDVMPVSTPTGPLSVRITGRAAVFPSLDPTVPFLVADAETLETAAFDATGFPLPAKEWWLRTDPARTADVVAALEAPPFAASSIVDRAALARSLATDPVPLAVVGILALGSIAALVFAGVGFLVGATVSASERRGEFALLRALGLSSAQLSVQIALESVFLLVIGFGGGTALGLVLSWLVLPYATLSADGAAVVPPPTIVVPWEALLPLCVLSAGLLLVTVVAARRQVPGDRISGVLRVADG